MILRICHCGHDIDTHFKSKHACLGMMCGCVEYQDRDIPLPKPAKKAKAPPAPVDDEDTQPMAPDVSHPLWCTCSACMHGIRNP